MQKARIGYQRECQKNSWREEEGALLLLLLIMKISIHVSRDS
jgi:hypothetical protein